ncbi:Arginyl-tRNA synthetase [Caldithrix abyssi DSM 13497]|uniref:Arginine--tRNA ligase n=1 Tax=Caldithrix abyssi DSM 13497 TaxID=880073 RepID=H1XSE3_CALAY|nr:arginine--tRNA ligase [Caldithrix abyssi]APF17220.1 argS arginyl-tRNA synthetase [Caldithrix abyssi DSM 13497]EHO41355.1 Arginyl-tRNA synthetase [Caldithrix abyssi DSM 13497]
MTTQEYIVQELQRFLKAHNIKDVEIILERPREEKFGDFASNLALQLARHLKKNPRQIAEEIKDFINQNPDYISAVEIAGPGFINFFASNVSLYKQLGEILEKKAAFGKSAYGRGKKANIEFVSANPTGPLTIGHGRGAVLGDTIARLLETIGYQVTREYYFNNAGRQMRILGDSVRLRYRELCGEQIEFPEDYYQGQYIIDIARRIFEEKGDALKDEEDVAFFKDYAEDVIFEDIKKTIKRLGFEFDVFYNEKSLYDEGKIDEVVKQLKEKGLVAERDGAVWFLTSKLGFEKDRVIIKSTGEPTYRLPDIAYHVEKVKRGFDLIIDIFGADHIATYPDVLAAVKALGYDADKIKVLIHQFVTLYEGEEKVKMSTRKANFVTLDELMDEVGVDVTRFFFLMRSMNSHLNFDLTLAKKQSDENPVFYIQYAHARICSILKLAESRGIELQASRNFNLLKAPEELNLIKHLVQFPQTIETAALSFEPHRMVNYLFDLATLFHKFYTECRVISDDQALTQARLALIDAVRIVIANGLGVLGISAPEHM